MTNIIPLVFSVLSIVSTDSVPVADIAVTSAGGVEMIAPVDTIGTDYGFVVVSDVLAMDGGSRRILTAYTSDGRIADIIDGGSWGEEGFADNLYVTNRHNNTVSAYLTVADANPVFLKAPEGGTIIELTDCIALNVIDFDDNATYRYILRDNQVTYKIGEDGTFALMSIRPKPNDRVAITRTMAVYDLYSESPDKPLTANELDALIKTCFPIPGHH